MHSNPYDITLTVKDGKEFKAHRLVLSETSPFFEKLLNSGMKENKEGVIRLETFTGTQMVDILEFIYTGNVKISTQENAASLIAAADYLILSDLKLIASKFLEQNLSISTCVHTFYLADQYLCDELAQNTRKFIHSNFAYVAETEQFMHLPCCEVERWLSSDDIVIRAEEDVFKVIIKWIDYAKNERNVQFNALFRHVRLTCVSRVFLISDVISNDLVQKNKVCLDAVTSALAWIDRPNDRYVSRPHSPRKSLETSVIAFGVRGGRWYPNFGVYFYVPERNEFFGLFETSDSEVQVFPRTFVFSCRGKLFFVSNDIRRALCYDPDLNWWSPAPWSADSNLPEFIADRRTSRVFLREVLVDKNDICFIVEERGRGSSNFWMWKYDLEANQSTIPVEMGQDVNYLALYKESDCVVAVDKYIYFIGGLIMISPDPVPGDAYDSPGYYETLSHCARFDTRENEWQDTANLQQARHQAFGAGTHEKIFIAGGRAGIGVFNSLKTCEVYNVETDEWHFMASLTFSRWHDGGMVLAGDTLYVLSSLSSQEDEELIVQCYDQGKDEWNLKKRIPVQTHLNTLCKHACSFRIFKGALDNIASCGNVLWARDHHPLLA